MMGDRDYRQFIRNALDSLARELHVSVDASDANKIHLGEVTRCLRRSYYDRDSPAEETARGFNYLLAGMLRKLGYAPDEASYDIGGMTIVGRADMIIDDVAMIFRPATAPPETPEASDMLYLNACMWIHDKIDGVIVYITGDAQETSFSLARDKKMFEEVVRRVRVLGDLLREKKRLPILEPSSECGTCQYYERCYAKQRIGRPVKLSELVGLNK